MPRASWEDETSKGHRRPHDAGGDVRRQRATLRVDRPRNNQYANVRLAAAYELVRFELI
jgi:hypothetical protein